MTRTRNEPPVAVVFLAGPTASGKSAVALELARLLPLEIISVDSALVYRGLDIGTAKPSAGERAAVPHHLIDIRDPAQPYSAAEFASDARRLIAAIQSRGRTPLLVGGTLLYFKALLQGLDALPAANAVVRQRIAARAARLGWPALHAELARIDPTTAARLAPADRQRIQRALEVWEITRSPLSALQTAAAPSPAPPYFYTLEPESRAWLHARIAQRFDAMMAAGLVEEVIHLHHGANLPPELPAMRAVGYRQVLDTLEGRAPADTLRQRGVAATRQLAKRQLTWLRRIPGRQVLTVGENVPARDLAQRIADQWMADHG